MTRLMNRASGLRSTGRHDFPAVLLILLTGVGGLAGYGAYAFLSPDNTHEIATGNETAWIEHANNACITAIIAYQGGGTEGPLNTAALAAEAVGVAATTTSKASAPTTKTQRLAQEMTVLASAQSRMATAIRQGTITQGLAALASAEAASTAVAGTAHQLGAADCVEMTTQM